MPDYAYTAIDPKGREKTGRLTAASDDAARAKLTERNFYVVRMETALGGKNKQGKTSAGLFGPKKLSSKELTLFTRQLSSLAQVSPLEEALRLIGNQNEKPHVQQRIRACICRSFPPRRIPSRNGPYAPCPRCRRTP